MQRIDKLLAHALSISRSDVSRLIRNKMITVNGELVKSGSLKVSSSDEVLYENNVIVLSSSKRYFMLNKPQGYVCANNDANYPCVTSLLDEPSAYLLHSAGRLDVDTTGLVLLTDDGDWSHTITSPKKRCQKIYHVTLKHPLLEDYAVSFKKGILLKQEREPTEPATLTYLNEYECLVQIYEGKYHQVKRMFGAVGNRVVALKRLQIGSVILDDTLNEGEYRELNYHEVSSFTK